VKLERMSALALLLAVIALGVAVAAWRQARLAPPPSDAAAPAGEWLRGTTTEQLRDVERQLRGLDVAMAEIGYRFTELHFAGQDRNWDYARYQAEKIDLTLRLALERRPKRARSAQPFLEEDLPAVRAAIESREPARFAAAMERLRTACMKCHADENVPHFTVELPRQRLAPIRRAP